MLATDVFLLILILNHSIHLENVYLNMNILIIINLDLVDYVVNFLEMYIVVLLWKGELLLFLIIWIFVVFLVCEIGIRHVFISV